MNPLIPGTGDMLLAFAVTLNVVLVIAALVTLAMAADKRGWLSAAVLILFVPLVGPIVSIIASRARRSSGSHPERETATVS